jgi:hypothetical protein
MEKPKSIRLKINDLNNNLGSIIVSAEARCVGFDTVRTSSVDLTKLVGVSCQFALEFTLNTIHLREVGAAR